MSPSASDLLLEDVADPAARKERRVAAEQQTVGADDRKRLPEHGASVSPG